MNLEVVLRSGIEVLSANPAQRLTSSLVNISFIAASVNHAAVKCMGVADGMCIAPSVAVRKYTAPESKLHTALASSAASHSCKSDRTANTARVSAGRRHTDKERWKHDHQTAEVLSSCLLDH